MGLALVLILLALALGGLAVLIEAITWALTIAIVLFLAGALVGWTRRRA